MSGSEIQIYCTSKAVRSQSHGWAKCNFFLILTKRIKLPSPELRVRTFINRFVLPKLNKSLFIVGHSQKMTYEYRTDILIY